MGQRLVIELVDKGERVASIYYHWSAYFTSTIAQLGLLSQDILSAEENHEDVLYSILKGLEERGGMVRGFGLPEYENETKAATELFPNHKFKTDGSRNEGLISFTEQGFNNFMDWCEGYAQIELDSHKIHNSVSYDGDMYLDFDYKPVGENGEHGYISSVKSGTVHAGNLVCPVNAFELTCESIFELGEFLGLTEHKE